MLENPNEGVPPHSEPEAPGTAVHPDLLVSPPGANSVSSPIPMFPYVTWILLSVNVIVHIMTYLIPTISAWGSATRNAVFSNFELYRLFTAMFLHASDLHLISNMYGLLVFGTVIERYYGHRRVLLIYLTSGVLGYAFSLLLLPPYLLTLGASGAVFGLAAAFLVCFRERRKFLSRRMGVLIALTLFALYQGFQSGFQPDSGVNNWAHLGGAVTGALIAVLTQRYFSFHFYPENSRPDALIEYHPLTMRRAMAVLGIAVTAVLLTVGVSFNPTVIHYQDMTLTFPMGWVSTPPNATRLGGCRQSLTVDCFAGVEMSLNATGDAAAVHPIIPIPIGMPNPAFLDSLIAGIFSSPQVGLALHSHDSFTIAGRPVERRIYTSDTVEMNYMLIESYFNIYQFFFFYPVNNAAYYRASIDWFIVHIQFDVPNTGS